MKSSFDEYISVVDRPRRLYANKGEFWRKEDPVIDADDKIVKGGFWRPQREWWDLKTFIKVMVGGYGSGKSFVAAKRAISLALTNAPAPVALVSPTFRIARETTVVAILSLLVGKQRLLGRSFAFKWNKSLMEFTIFYKGRTARILILSGEEPEYLKGPNLGAAGIDEPFIQDVEVFHQMVARVRHPDATQREIFLTGTPEQLNWGYDLVTGGLKGWKSDKVGVVRASSRDNKATGTQYIENLESSFTAKDAEAYIDGHFLNLTAGQVLHAFDRRQNVRRIEKPNYAQYGFGIDFNVNPMAAMVFWHTPDHIHFLKEYEFPNSDTEYACDEISAEWWDQGLRVAYPDATGANRKTSSPGGKTDYWYIRAAGFEIEAAPENPPVRDRFVVSNSLLKPRRGQVHLTVDPRCEKFIKYANVYTWENKNKTLGKSMSHLIDAATYPLYRLRPFDPVSGRSTVPTTGY